MFAFVTVPVVAVTIVFGNCPGSQRSCYYIPTNSVYIAPSEWTIPVMRPSLVTHELGHAYDFQVMDDGDRRLLSRWLPDRGPWRSQAPADTAAHDNSGAELFAEAYADCAMRVPWRNRRVCGWLYRRTHPLRLPSR